jgi:hypothetical protein
MQGYEFPGSDLATLILRRFYPERTDRSSTVIRDWLLAHGTEYDRFAFSVRVGQPVAPDPSHLPGVQRSTVFSSQKRIDVLAWAGAQPTIVEVKEYVTAAALGQIQLYRDLFREEMPDALEPILLVIGRFSDADTLRVLTSHGVNVLLYEPTEDGR